MPPRAILAAVSFSDSSRVALVLAARLARHCDAELHVLHVEDPLLAAAARYEGIDLSTETYVELQRFVAGAWPAAQCLPQTHVLAGAAVDVILDVAHRHRADLVVVDSGRMSSVERSVFGSTTKGLLRRADVSVLVAPTEWTPPQPDTADLSDLGPLVVVVDLADPKSVPATRRSRSCTSFRIGQAPWRIDWPRPQDLRGIEPRSWCWARRHRVRKADGPARLSIACCQVGRSPS